MHNLCTAYLIIIHEEIFFVKIKSHNQISPNKHTTVKGKLELKGEQYFKI